MAKGSACPIKNDTAMLEVAGPIFEDMLDRYSKLDLTKVALYKSINTSLRKNNPELSRLFLKHLQKKNIPDSYLYVTENSNQGFADFIDEDVRFDEVYADDFARFNDGTLLKFDSKDDIVGMKEGGTLSTLLKGAVTEGVVIKDVFDKAVASEIQRSNQFLAQLVQLTAQMVSNQGNNTAPVVVQNQANNDMSGSMDGPAYSDTRSNYVNSPYSYS